MIRILLYLTLLALAAFSMAWLATHPGDVAITWGETRIETSLAAGVMLLVLTGALIAATWGFVRFLVALPQRAAARVQARKRSKGLHALTQGMIALGAGDMANARRLTIDAERYAADQALTLLLKAQVAQAEGDRATALAAFEAMTQRRDMKLLGLRGLYIESRRGGDSVKAHALAQEAARVSPRADWAIDAVLAQKTAFGDWRGARDLLDRRAALKKGLKQKTALERAALLTAEALKEAETHPPEALKTVQAALKLNPVLIPAAALAARLLIQSDQGRKAARIIERAWEHQPHPDLAQAYLNLRAGESAKDRLDRARILVRLAPHHPESALSLARAHLDARQFQDARNALAPLFERAEATVRVYLLMAEIEERDGNSIGKIREYLSKAAHAPRDPVWMADGTTFDTWLPYSPISGRLNALEWTAPALELKAPNVSETASEREPLPEEVIASSQANTSPPLETRSKAQPERVPSIPQATQSVSSLPKATPVIFPLPQPPDDPGSLPNKDKARLA